MSNTDAERADCPHLILSRSDQYILADPGRSGQMNSIDLNSDDIHGSFPSFVIYDTQMWFLAELRWATRKQVQRRHGFKPRLGHWRCQTRTGNPMRNGPPMDAAALVLDLLQASPEQLAAYAVQFVRRRWPEAEQFILRDAYASFYYAWLVLRAPWPEAEPVFRNDPRAWLMCNDYIHKHRRPGLYEFMAFFPHVSLEALGFPSE